MTGVKRDCGCVRVRHAHGEYLMYELHRCGCFECRVAWSHARQRQRAGGRYSLDDRWVDRTGVDRRIRALLAIGWRHGDISALLSEHLGRPARSQEILKHPGRWSYRATRDAMVAVYDRLSMTPGPSQRNRSRAAKAGYLPPLAWDDETLDDPAARPNLPADEPAALDEVLVERYMHGQVRRDRYRVPPERLEAIRRLAGRGLSDSQIGSRLRMTGDSVQKERDRHGIPAGQPKERAA